MRIRYNKKRFPINNKYLKIKFYGYKIKYSELVNKTIEHNNNNFILYCS